MSDGPGFGQLPVGAAVQPCPNAAQQPTPAPALHWIEIHLHGEDGSPVPLEPYRVTLPNGDVVTGYLDENANARIENIGDAGDCQVMFPALDQDAWGPG